MHSSLNTVLAWNCLTYKNKAKPPRYINGGYRANGYMANSQCSHFSVHIALNQIGLAGKVSWNPIWHLQGPHFSHISLPQKWISNEPRAHCLSVRLHPCLCSAQQKLPALIPKIHCDDSAWSQINNLSCPSYLTTVLVPDFGNTKKWGFGNSK